MSQKSAKQSSSKKWWADGVQFECQGSGKCCVSHGQYGYVYLTLQDRRQMAAALNISTPKFTKTHCVKVDGLWRLQESGSSDCRFLVKKKCSVYEARPMQCRTWPWWPEVMSPKAWSRDVAQFCPGVGKGRTWTEAEIDATLKIQKSSNDQL